MASDTEGKLYFSIERRLAALPWVGSGLRAEQSSAGGDKRAWAHDVADFACSSAATLTAAAFASPGCSALGLRCAVACCIEIQHATHPLGQMIA